jgi:hypothetical protein
MVCFKYIIVNTPTMVITRIIMIIIIIIIMQKISGQHSGKIRNQGTTENSHIGHCTHTAGSANVKV